MQKSSQAKTKKNSNNTLKNNQRISTEIKSPNPLSFSSKPCLNFMFGHQLAKSPPAPNSKQQPNIQVPFLLTARSSPKKSLSKYLNPKPVKCEVRKIPEIPEKTEADKQANETESYIEINMGDDPLSNNNDEITIEDLNLIKKHLNEKAAEISQKTTISIKSLEQPDSVQTCLKEKQCEELSKEGNGGSQKLKEENNLLRKLIEGALLQLTLCENTIRSYIDFTTELAKINNDPKIIDRERIVKYQVAFNYLTPPNGKKIINQLNAVINKLQRLSQAKKSEEQEEDKYGKQLTKIKEENKALIQQTAELEKEILLINNINLKNAEELHCGIQDTINLRKEKDEWKEKYNELLKKNDPPLKINKLAAILAYLPKRRKIWEESTEIKATVKKQPEDETCANNMLQDKINELNTKLIELIKSLECSKKENADLLGKYTTIIGIVKLKDQQIDGLTKELNFAKQQIEELVKKLDQFASDIHNKDKNFAEKLTEFKGIFEEMKKEKEEKQKKIIEQQDKLKEYENNLNNLQEKIRQLEEEKKILLNENEKLNAENEKLNAEIEKYFSPEAIDGFQALVSLANMILARSNRPPSLSIKEKDLIQEIFNANIKVMLKEIDNLQQENKILKEELRNLVNQNNGAHKIFQNIMDVQ